MKSKSKSLIDAINATEKDAKDAMDSGDYKKAAELTAQAKTFKDAYNDNVR